MFEINIAPVWSNWLPDSLSLLLAAARRAVTNRSRTCRDPPWKRVQLPSVTNRGQCSTTKSELCPHDQGLK